MNVRTQKDLAVIERLERIRNALLEAARLASEADALMDPIEHHNQRELLEHWRGEWKGRAFVVHCLTTEFGLRQEVAEAYLNAKRAKTT